MLLLLLWSSRVFGYPSLSLIAASMTTATKLAAAMPKVAVSPRKTSVKTALSLTTFPLGQSQRRSHRKVIVCSDYLIVHSLKSIEDRQSTKNGINNPNQGRIHVRLILIPPSTHCNVTKLNPYPSGGLELLFSSQRSHKIALPSSDPATNQPVNVGFLIDWLCKNLMKDPRQDMFVLEGTV